MIRRSVRRLRKAVPIAVGLLHNIWIGASKERAFKQLRAEDAEDEPTVMVERLVRGSRVAEERNMLWDSVGYGHFFLIERVGCTHIPRSHAVYAHVSTRRGGVDMGVQGGRGWTGEGGSIHEAAHSKTLCYTGKRPEQGFDDGP